MEYASDAYRAAMAENVREKSYVWLTLDLVNYYAQDSAYISSSFTGDESYIYKENSLSSITSSESDGHVTFTFDGYSTLSLNGITVTLDEDSLPAGIVVTNGTQSKTVTVSDEIVTVEQSFDSTHTITITPTDNTALTIKKIHFGVEVEFDNLDIMSTERRNTVVHINTELPLKEFYFVLQNYNRLWNKDNPTSMSRFLQEKQKVHYKYGRLMPDDSIYEIDGGIVYLQSWESNDYQARFQCVGLLDYLTDEYKLGRLYPNGITLYQLAEFVLIDAGIEKYELDTCLRTFTVNNPLPVDTHKACLQLIAHAGRCVLYEDRNGAVCLKSVDRPEILKTATLYDATSFSNGEDVITKTTNANYGATEPDYTYADGLHYFFPKVNTPSENALMPYDDTRTNIDGVDVTVDEDGYISFSGVSSKYGNYAVEYKIKDTWTTIPAGEYIFGAYPSKESGSVSRAYGVAPYTQGSVIRGHYAELTIKNLANVYSYNPVNKRTFVFNTPVQVKSSIWISEPDSTYDFYPRLIRTSEEPVEEEGYETLPVGFVSEEYANSSGTFTTTPKISIKLASPGVLSEVVLNCTVAPKDFTIKVYYGETLKETATFTDNTNKHPTRSFNKIKCDRVDITFTKTTAYQRIHVNNVDLAVNVEYTITYKDLTDNPVANSLEKVSRLNVKLYSYTELESEKSSRLGYPTVNYEENDGGGLDAIITTGASALTTMNVVAGENIISLSNVSEVSSVEYNDEGQGIITVIESGAHYVKVNCSRDGNVVVKGTEYLETIKEYIVPVNEIGNEINVNNPLLSTEEHFERIKSWLMDYYNNDIEYDLLYRGDPILDADDLVFLENQFVDDNLIRIETETLSTSAGMDPRNSIVARRISYTERIEE